MKVEDVNGRPACRKLLCDRLADTAAATRNYRCLSVQPERSRHHKLRSEE
jgi:hypothetical protein